MGYRLRSTLLCSTADIVLCTVTTTGVVRPASRAAHSATRLAWLREETRHPGPLPAQVGGKRTDAPKHPGRPEIHQPHSRRHLVQQGADRRREHQIHRQTPLGDALDQVDDDPLRAAAVEAGEEERDGSLPWCAHAQSSSVPSQRDSARL